MFSFLKPKTHKELEPIIQRIESNMANNYKDAAQEAFRDLEEKLKILQLSEVQKSYYVAKRDNYAERMKGFTHKDQKPYWT